MERKRVGILIFDDVEVLDFCGPFEVFSVARLNEEKQRDEESPFNVKLVSEKGELVTTSGGMRVLPDYSFENCPALNILCIPCGWGTRREIHNQRLLSWIAEFAGRVETLASICTGSMLLGHAGLLDGLRATTHWRSLDWMEESFPSVTVERGRHVVENDRIITSAGISAGIDMALRIVERYFGKEIAKATARQMEYPWHESNERRI